MNHFQRKLSNVCATQVEFGLDGGVVHSVAFKNGCDGNLKALGFLIDGMDASRVAGLFSGNTCGKNKTSCADQFAKVLIGALAEQRK